MFGARLMKPPISVMTRPLALSPKPHIEDIDSALICTGTGETRPVLSMARSWLHINKNVGLISSFAAKDYASKIFSHVTNPNVLILLPGITQHDIKRRRTHPDEIHTPLIELFYAETFFMPSPTIFELTVLLFLESVITQLFFECKGDTPCS
jgi:ferredoxin-NADP reductase